MGNPYESLGPTSAAAWRATAAFALYAAGQVLALELWSAGAAVPSAAWFGMAAIALAAGAAGGRRVGAPMLALALLLLAGGRFTSRILEQAPPSLALAIPPEPAPGSGSIASVEGVVLERARELAAEGALAGFVPRGEPSVSFRLRAQAAVGEKGQRRRVSGVVRVTVRAGGADVPPGDRVRVTGIVRPIEPPRNPGESDARLWAAQDGQVATMTLASADLMEPLDAPASLLGRIESVWLTGRGWLRARAGAVLGEPDGGGGRAMLGALLLGEIEPGISQVRSAFARQGLAHVLAISGFHLAVMAAAALFAVRLTGDRGRLEPVLVALLVVLYMAILPAQAPILRSGAIVLVWLASESLGRRYDRRALLAWVGIGVLVLRPMDLYSLGYQLTFGITAALVWWGERVHSRLFPERLTFERHEPPDIFEPRWWVDGLTRLVSASILCWLVATPLVARAAGIVSPTAVLATLVVVPVVTVLLWVGYGAMLVGVLVPPAGGAAAWVLDLLSRAVIGVVEFFDRIPGTTLYAPKLSALLTAALTALVAWWLLRGRVRSPGLWAATLLGAGWLAGEVYAAGRLPARSAFRIDTIDVGDGACHLLRSGGEAILWDCGSQRPSIGVRTIPRALRELGAWRVREVVITHPNFDHYSGLLDAAPALGVRRVYVPRAFLGRAAREPHGATAVLAAGLAARGIRVVELGAGARMALGATELEFLSPPPNAPFAADNDNSLVAMARVATGGGERRLLLCGDIQREAMAALMAPEADLAADILELPHHGSVHATALDFVARVDPAVVVQSTGPSRATEIAWNELRLGREWLMTAIDGAAWVEIGADGEITSGAVRRRR